MADNIENNDEKILDVIGDMSFLPKEAIDENAGRPFPKLHQIETKVRFGYTMLFTLLSVAFLVCLFILGPKGYYYPTKIKGSYGPLGIVSTALFVISICSAHFYSYLFDSKLSLEKGEDVIKKGQAFTTSMYYVSFALLYFMFFTTVLRHWVFETYFPDGNFFAVNLGIFTLILVILLAVCGIFFAFKNPQVGKIYNYVILGLGLWIVVFFRALLGKNYSMSDKYGILYLIFGAIFADLALIALIFQKNRGFRSAFHGLLSISAMFEALTILIQGMVHLG